MKQQRVAGLSLATVVAVVASLLVTARVGAQTDPVPTRVQVTPGIAPREVTRRGEQFFDKTFSLRVVSAPVHISNISDGMGAFTVDDMMIVTITRPDGSQSSFSHDFSQNCTRLQKKGPFDITSLTAPGVNRIRIQMRDVCGVKVGSSQIWLHNPEPAGSPPPSPSPSTAPTPSPTASVTPAASPRPSSTPSASPSPSPSESVGGEQFVRHRTPDLKWVGYLDLGWRGVPGCVVNLLRGLFYISLKNATLVCLGLKITANRAPPRRFTSKSWERFKRSKQYRSYVHVPPLTYDCNQDNRIVAFYRRGIARSEGYTPHFAVKRTKKWPYIKIGLQAGFDRGERYTQRRLGFNKRTATYRLSSGNRVLNVTYLQASRVSRKFRRLTYHGVPGPTGRRLLRLRRDWPFIWTFVHMRLTCRGAGAKMTSSSIPARVLYINGRRVRKSPQSRDVARFFRAGGRRLHAAGRGNLDPNCHRMRRTLWGRASFLADKRLCRKEIPGW